MNELHVFGVGIQNAETPAPDVEPLARLIHPPAGVEPVGSDAIVEVPLRAWRDVAGSKVRPSASVRAVLALLGVRRRIRKRRRARPPTRS